MDDALPGRGPKLDRGFDEIGRFAYTRQECDDRIALVDEAEAYGWTKWQPETSPRPCGRPAEAPGMAGHPRLDGLAGREQEQAADVSCRDDRLCL